MSKSSKDSAAPKQAWKWSHLEPPQMTILADHAILHAGPEADDQLDLPPRMAAVYDILRNRRTQTPMAVAIYGDWGTGKTSAMRWLRDRLNKWNQQTDFERAGHAIVESVWFDPWKYQTREDVWRGLIAEVILGCITVGEPPADGMVPWINRAAKLFGAYVGRPLLAALSRIDVKIKAGTKDSGVEATIKGEAFQAVIDEYNKVIHPEHAYLNDFERTLEEWVKQFFPQQIKDGVRQSPRRLAVMIDDLDRCLPKVTLQVLEALKLYLNIPGLLFVVGLDRSVVDAVVQKEYHEQGVEKHKSEKYLDKMFQVEVHIPPTQTQTRDFFEKLVKELDAATEWNWTNLLNAAAGGKISDYKEILEDKIAVLASDNPREIKRSLNSTLRRAWAAYQNEKLIGDNEDDQKRALRFAQGAQVYLVQCFLKRTYEKEALILRDDALHFFENWSAFLQRFPDYDARGKSDRTEAPEEGVALNRAARRGTSSPEAEVAYKELLEQQARLPGETALTLLNDEHLRDLMKIPFSAAVGKHAPAAPTAKRADLASESGDAKSARDLPEFLVAAIARSLDKPVADLTDADVTEVTSIVLSGAQDLSDLTPLRGLTQLQTLDLNQTAVSDLTPLEQLTQLRWLYLDQTAVSDLTPLQELTQLERLYLNQTAVSDLTPLKGLTQLQTLVLNQTVVSDLTPLQGLTQLQWLNLSQTAVSDLTPLQGLSQLRQLFLSLTDVSDLTPLQGLTQLQWLRLDQTAVSDLTPLQGLTQLQGLHLNQTAVSDLTPLQGLTNLVDYKGPPIPGHPKFGVKN